MSSHGSKSNGFETFQLDLGKFRNIKLREVKERLEYVSKFFEKMPPPSGDGAFVLVISEGEPKKWISLEAQKQLIGRAEDADIQIFDPNVSRIHCRIEENNRTHTIEDNGSRNGILVNGEKTSSRRLCDGDIVKIGDSELIFVKNSGAESDLFS